MDGQILNVLGDKLLELDTFWRGKLHSVHVRTRTGSRSRLTPERVLPGARAGAKIRSVGATVQ